MPLNRKRTYTSFEEYIVDEDELSHAVSTVISDTVSADGRRIKRTTHPILTPISPPKKRTRTPGTAQHEEDHGILFSLEHDEDLLDDATIQIGPPKRNKHRSNRYFVSTEHDSFLSEWIGQRDRFLDELLRLEGLRDRKTICVGCSTNIGTGAVRCTDCSGSQLLCASCCVSAHGQLPFHAVEQWNGRHFISSSLQQLGFVLQLGHAPGDVCPKPSRGPLDFMVMHTNGHHKVTVNFCRCSQMGSAGDDVQQLLRYELFPATVVGPSTCATFRLLETFHLLTLQSKTTPYDFYLTLNNLSDNTGLRITWDRFKQFLRMVREWAHLKMLKRAGRGHEPGGSAATNPGELCLVCPACPHPGFNLPENWEDTPQDLRYIYTLIVAIDANFRLKRRAVSSDARDPALGSGWGYYVEDTAYREHVLKYADQEDISTCTGFAALSQANTRFSKGYAATGVGMAVCARHGFILPNAVGDLQKGERYCNMDYIVASTLSLRENHTPTVLSYDIACQWSVHLKDRWKQFPSHLQVQLPEGELRYAIPKYHFRAHKSKGHNQYSLHLMKGVGRVCGEQIERNWPKHSETAASTREMGPGSRHDTLEDHFGYANWRVYVNLGRLFYRQHNEAVKESTAQNAVFAEFTERLQDENVASWIAEAEAYERDPTSPDPYYRETTGLSEADIRLQLAEEDDKAAEEGELSLHEITPAAMLLELLELEDQQRKFRRKYPASLRKGPAAGTAFQNAELMAKRTALRRRLANIRVVQAIYMPCVPQKVAQYLSATTQKDAAISRFDLVEDQPLFLPHQLSVEELEPCAPGLADMEERLRVAQLHDSLDRLRVQLHIKTRLVTFKNRNVRHQGPNTRARRRLDVNESKIIDIAEKYRSARAAKLELSGHGSWERQWRELAKTDVRTMLSEDTGIVRSDRKVREGDAGVSEGRHKPSWIWMAADTDETGDEMQSGIQDAVRIEYLRARARKMRFKEQLRLLKEEKRRVLESLRQEALIWDRREQEGLAGADATGQGKAAYAARQGEIRRLLAHSFCTLWSTQIDTDEPDASSHALATADDDPDVGAYESDESTESEVDSDEEDT